LQRLPKLLAVFLALQALWLSGLPSLADGAESAKAAEPALGSENSGYSELEERMLSRSLDPKAEREPRPQGKRIQSIQVVRQPVFDEDDPVPDFVNVLHTQTREHVIRRELLFEAGESYDLERVQETLRNLQLIPQLGVVVIVALRGSDPDSVRVVVIVRDVWSLRLNYALEGNLNASAALAVVAGRITSPGGSGTSSSINYFLLNLSEDNLFGLHARLGALFILEPDRYSVGALTAYPRVLKTAMDAYGLGGVIFNRDSGKTEGSFGTLSLRQDLKSFAQEWGFLVGSSWRIEQTRLYEDLEPQRTSSGIPIQYAASLVRGGGEVTRSFGRRLKTDLTWGLELNQRKFKAERAPDTPAESFAELVAEMPVSDTRLSPFFQIRHNTSRFLATRDVETLALQESFSLGHWTALRLYPALRELGSSRDLLGVVSWLGYTWPLGDGLLRVVGSSSIEQANQGKHQATAQGALRAVSPRSSVGRLVLDAVVVSTYQNYLNRKLALGGDTRPRGYVSADFRGASAIAGSLEFRSFAVNVLSARIGAVAFYDLGGASDSLAELALNQSIGAGVRILFPQLNRQVFRLDWGAPLTPGLRGYRPFPGGIYFTFRQAFEMPGLRLPEILGAETTLLSQSQ